MVDPRTSAKFPDRILDPMDRISEVLFGLIMALTFTCTLGVAAADDIHVRSMLLAALGCNLAWGIIDGGVYLMARLNERGRALINWRSVHDETNAGAAHRIILDTLPPLIASAFAPAHLESIRQKLKELPAPERPHLTKDDWLGALGICLLSFLSTFPIVVPFALMSDTRFALRVSNAVAIAMLFSCGYLYGRYAGIQPWRTGIAMVAIGGALVGVAFALGG
jgi:VIT family